MRARSTSRDMRGERSRMGATSPSSASERQLAEALWLAREEVKWAWPSYVLSVLVVLFLGLAAAFGLSFVVSGLEGFVLRHHRTVDFSGAFFADYLFLLVCAVLGANTIYGYYTQNWRETFSSRLIFLRSLPISAVALVGSRAISMLFALVLGALAFFVPVFFLSGLGEELGMEAYLCFCGVWIGYGLLGSGLWLLFEFGVSGRTYALISYFFALLLMLVVEFAILTRDSSLVVGTAQLVQGGHGPLLAGFSILTGGAAFLLLSGATVYGLQKRDSSA